MPAVGYQYFPPGLRWPSHCRHRASPLFWKYQHERGTCVNNLPRIVTYVKSPAVNPPTDYHCKPLHCST